MPTSRKRRTRTSPDKLGRRRKRQRAEDSSSCFTLPGTDISQLDDILTPADIQAFADCIDASAAGDPALALACLRRGLIVQGTPHVPHLQELIDLGDEAPSWALSRWVADQTYRWMLHEHDPRTDEAVIAVMAYCYPDVDLDRPLGLSLKEFGTRIAAGDWVAQQLAVYEFGGLDDFLDVKIGDALLERCGPVRRWSSARLGGYRIEDCRGGVLELTDLRDGSRRTALDIGATSDRGRGCTVLGRLVPIDVEPGWFFESRPLDVDERTARAVATACDVSTWLDAFYAARASDRVPIHFSRGERTPLTCDVVPLDGCGHTCSHHDDLSQQPNTAPALRELEEAGLDPLRANNIGVCDVALIAALVAPDAIAAVSGPLQAVLVDRRTYDAALVHRTGPEHADGWRALAAVVPEPVRSRCLTLADHSTRRAA